MTDQATRVVAAGWYDDPQDPRMVRWWNGLGWTTHVELKPERAPEPPVVVTQQPAQPAQPVQPARPAIDPNSMFGQALRAQAEKAARKQH